MWGFLLYWLNVVCVVGIYDEKRYRIGLIEWLYVSVMGFLKRRLFNEQKKEGLNRCFSRVSMSIKRYKRKRINNALSQTHKHEHTCTHNLPSRLNMSKKAKRVKTPKKNSRKTKKANKEQKRTSGSGISGAISSWPSGLTSSGSGIFFSSTQSFGLLCSGSLIFWGARKSNSSSREPLRTLCWSMKTCMYGSCGWVDGCDTWYDM